MLKPTSSKSTMALDPLSGASKPLPPPHLLSSKNPLPFAATFHDTPLLAPFEHSGAPGPSSRSPFARTVSASGKDQLRDESFGRNDGWRHTASLVQTDQWMEGKIAECVDRADGNMDLGQCGLESLSTKISDLQYLVTLSSRSPYTPTPRTQQKSSPHSTKNIHHSPSPSYGNIIPRTRLDDTRISPFSASTRTFSRIVSAPVVGEQYSGDGGMGREKPLSTTLAHYRVNLGSPMSSSLSKDDDRVSALDVPIDFGGFDPPGSPVTSPFTPTPTQSHRSPSLAPPPSSPSTSHRPPSQSPFSNRAFTRTASGGIISGDGGRWYGKGRADVDLTLATNSLKELPSALFQVTNLVTLSLRQNFLKSLPAAIGVLENLKELNVSGNQIRFFPPAILDLNLEQFYYTGNPLIPCPPHVDNKSFPSGRLLGDLVINSTDVPSLRSLCISQLLSTRRPDDLPALLSRIDWEPVPGSKDPHGLKDADSLQLQIPCLRDEECHRILACLRSAYHASNSSRTSADRIPNPAFSPSTGRVLGKTSIAPPTDDASMNPFYTACPSPHHVDANQQEGSNNHVTRRIYLHKPAEERLEWVKVKGADSLVPIKWQGCQRGCLDFLEKADEAVEDGFDIDVVAEGWE